MRLARTDRSLFAEWWFSVDRPLLGAVLLMMVIGALVSLAASPAAAHKIGEEPLYFFKRHLIFLGPSAVLLIGASMLDPKLTRRAGLLLFAGGIGLIVLAFLQGYEKNGAIRWLVVGGGLTVQPSEFAKPGFIILTAWLFAEAAKRRDMPALPISMLMLALLASLLIMQPDIGQTSLTALVWGGLFFLAGYSLVWIALAALAGGAGLTAAYFTVPHVQSRIDRFLSPGLGDTQQVDTALSAFRQGGWFGRGPGEGVVTPTFPYGRRRR
jgi:cell division protein FtsW